MGTFVRGSRRRHRRNGPGEEIRPGDRVFFEPGEEHWHGAAATQFKAHLAMADIEAAGNAATRGARVTDRDPEIPAPGQNCLLF
jgi:quercetin dioxygenase-like cupin family protein